MNTNWIRPPSVHIYWIPLLYSYY